MYVFGAAENLARPLFWHSSTSRAGARYPMGNKTSRDADLAAVGNQTPSGDDAAAHMTELSGLSSRVEVRRRRVKLFLKHIVGTSLMHVIICHVLCQLSIRCNDLLNMDSGPNDTVRIGILTYSVTVLLPAQMLLTPNSLCPPYAWYCSQIRWQWFTCTTASSGRKWAGKTFRGDVMMSCIVCSCRTLERPGTQVAWLCSMTCICSLLNRPSCDHNVGAGPR